MNDKLPINHMRHIENFVSGASECESVAVLVAGTDEWSAQKAIELIEAAPKMYIALGTINQFLANCPDDGTDPSFTAMVLNGKRAEAAARGGVLQSDLRMDKHAA
jgi:hypothetical protein